MDLVCFDLQHVAFSTTNFRGRLSAQFVNCLGLRPKLHTVELSGQLNDDRLLVKFDNLEGSREICSCQRTCLLCFWQVKTYCIRVRKVLPPAWFSKSRTVPSVPAWCRSSLPRQIPTLIEMLLLGRLNCMVRFLSSCPPICVPFARSRTFLHKEVVGRPSWTEVDERTLRVVLKCC